MKLPPAVVALLTAVLGGLTLFLFPTLDLGFFSAGSAKIAGLFCGAHPLRVDEGWLLSLRHHSVMITAECSGSHYFLIVAVLMSWQFARRGMSAGLAIIAGLSAAVPVALVTNSLRIVSVVQMHGWVIPHFPATYAPFLHLLTGVAVFLPSLIALNLLLESDGNPAPARR